MQPAPFAYVDQQAVTVCDMPDLIAQVTDRLARGVGFTLFTLNLDHLVKRRQLPAFRDLYARATIVTADGWPVVSLARRADPAIERTAGADMVVPLCRLAARRGTPVMLYGSTEAVLTTAAARLRELCPGLDIAGATAPPFGFEPLGDAGREAIAWIDESGCRLCFVALGAPKQEIFSDRAASALPQVGFVCIGAALDFIAGAHRRAPALLQRLRLEWAWRLCLQPRRLGLRYARCAALFGRLLLQPVSRDFGDLRS